MIQFETQRGTFIFKITACYVEQGRQTDDEDRGTDSANQQEEKKKKKKKRGKEEKDIRADISLCSWTREQRSPFTFRHVLTWSAHVWRFFFLPTCLELLCFRQQLPHWQNLSHSSVTNSTHRRGRCVEREKEGGKTGRAHRGRLPPLCCCCCCGISNRSGKT